MAKQAEGFLVGTYDDITFYKMEGQYYARMKSSLTGKKFWKHKAFEGSRKSCNRFGRGNQLASMVYKEIPESNRAYAMFCTMKQIAIAMLKAGKEEEQVINELRKLKPAEIVTPVVSKKKICMTEKARTIYTGKLVNFHFTRRSIKRRTKLFTVGRSAKYAVDSG